MLLALTRAFKDSEKIEISKVDASLGTESLEVKLVRIPEHCSPVRS